MTQTLFICEKPDVARALARALSTKHTEKKGYIEGDNGHIYTYAFGHLVTLAEPADYSNDYQKWSMEHLPIIPERFKLVAIKGKTGHLQTIKQLATKADLLVNACDSAREGATIYNFISIHLGLTKKPTKRLWTSSLTPEAIKKAYASMKDEKEYASMFYAGYARSQADWLVGMNSSRGFSLKTGEKFSIGRVQTAALAMILDRCEEHFNFKKTKYYPVIASFQQNNQSYSGKWEGNFILEKQKALELANKVKGQHGFIKEFDKKTTEIYAPKLYDLTLLQKEVNQKHSLSGAQILEIAQSLYEKHKCITYPRTNSNYVTKDDIPGMHEVLKAFQKSPYEKEVKGANPALVHTENKRVCNEKLVTDHHAIMPTTTIPSNLSKNEEIIYDFIVRRFLSHFYEPAIYDKYTVLTEVEKEMFKTNGSLLKSPGWKVLYQPEKENEKEDDELQLSTTLELAAGSSVLCTDSEVLEKETTPKPLYTDGTLIDAMAKVGKKLEDEELKEILSESGIGTVATRANILQKLNKIEYISYKGKSILITEKGRYLIETLRQTKITTLTSAEYTAQWEKKLNQIEKNQASAPEFISMIKKFTEAIIQEIKALESSYNKKIETLGNCPACKEGKIIGGKKAYGCSRWKEGCTFKIWRVSYNKSITEKMAQSLISKGETGVLTFISEKKKTKYKAKLVLTEKFEIKLEFVNNKK